MAASFRVSQLSGGAPPLFFNWTPGQKRPHRKEIRRWVIDRDVRRHPAPTVPAMSPDAARTAASARSSAGTAADALARRWRSGSAAPCDESRDRPAPILGREIRLDDGSRLRD